MSLNRRDFVKLCTGTVAGFGVSQMFHPAIRDALADTTNGGRPPVLWLSGQSCTGCSVSLLDTAHPTIADVLLKVISLNYHSTVMAGEGEVAVASIFDTVKANKGKFFLVMEGAVPTEAAGKYCIVAEYKHKEYTVAELLKMVAPEAAAVLAVGTCAAFGGIPAAKGSTTGAKSVSAFLKENKIATPVVNLSGCPPHPDWIVGTIVLALKLTQEKGLAAGLGEVVKILDADGRPNPFYGDNVHENCPHLQSYDGGKFCPSFTHKDGCRYELGCKGPGANCDSPKRKWNGGVNWCVENATCIGCTERDFPDGKSPFYSN
ncbi:MAG: hydrogenase small subunit [Betaproteobacteria bacterium]|nr:hydrogenase small subunit [Betaproteobacteria bacterium]